MNTNSASKSPIRIYVLEQNRLVREAFVQLLRKRSSLAVVGDSDDCSKAYGELTAIQCDVLLLNSLEILQVIRQKAETAECLKQTKLLLFGMKEDPECFLQAVRLGGAPSCTTSRTVGVNDLNVSIAVSFCQHFIRS